jgi:hypothetical protein
MHWRHIAFIAWLGDALPASAFRYPGLYLGETHLSLRSTGVCAMIAVFLGIRGGNNA